MVEPPALLAGIVPLSWLLVRHLLDLLERHHLGVDADQPAFPVGPPRLVLPGAVGRSLSTRQGSHDASLLSLDRAPLVRARLPFGGTCLWKVWRMTPNLTRIPALREQLRLRVGASMS